MVGDVARNILLHRNVKLCWHNLRSNTEASCVLLGGRHHVRVETRAARAGLKIDFVVPLFSYLVHKGSHWRGLPRAGITSHHTRSLCSLVEQIDCIALELQRLLLQGLFLKHCTFVRLML